MTPDGLVMVRSRVSVRETIDRMVAGAIKRDLIIFARIDHAAGAAQVGLALRPTELLILATRKAARP